jgi:2-keto-3-deoxy-L-rhamnonate aldolase RhmA
LHLTTVRRIRDACRAANVPVGIHTGGLEWTQKRLADGFNFVTLGSDLGFLMKAATQDLAAARTALGAKAG